jgi:drug/metabolite transporter (DMT)-like permease
VTGGPVARTVIEVTTSAAAPDAGVRSDPAPDRLALGAFAGAVLVGGSNFVAVRFSNRELDPLWGAGLRFVLAAAVFGVLVAVLRLPLPRGRVLGLIVTYGLIGFAGAYGCLYWAMKEVPAGIAAVVLAVGPLLTLLLAVAHRMERLNGRAVAGALIAVAGSAVIFFQRGSVDFGWTSFLLLVVAALAASESVIVSKRVGPEHPVVMNFIAVSAGAAALLVVSALAGETMALPEAGKTQIALVYLVAATVALFLSVLVVVQRWTASSTSYVFVLMPVVAVALGALVADERITATTVVGGGIVCAGVYLGALARSGRRAD